MTKRDSIWRQARIWRNRCERIWWWWHDDFTWRLQNKLRRR